MFINLVIVGMGNLINAFGGFAYLISASKILSVENFGKYSFLISFFIFMAKLTELGTTSSFVSLSIKEGKNYNKSLYVLKFILTVFVILISFPILLLYKFTNFEVFISLCVGYIGYVLNDYLFALFQKDESFIKTTFVNALPALFKLVFALLLISYFKTNDAPLLTTLNIYFFALFTSLFLFPFISKNRQPIPNNGIKDLARIGFPGGVSQALNTAIPAINSSIILLKTSFEGVGMFSLAEKLSSIFSLASFSIFTVLLPNKAKEIRERKNYSIKTSILLSIIIFSCAIFMSLLAKSMLYLLFAKYINILPIFYILIFSASFSAISGFLDNFFYVKEKTTTLLLINITKIFTLVISVFYLTQNFGITGAAYANLFTSILFTGITFLIILTER